MDEELIQIFDTNPMEIHSVNGPQFIPAQRYNPASKKPEPASMIGKVFGRWTVIGESVRTQSGERKWLCRCECGTQRYVLERSLRFGGSLSCGCLRKERSQKANSPDLTGQKFGELTAIRRVDSAERKGGARWLCQCACGAEYEVLGTLLVTGRRTHCPGKSHEKNYAYADITGKKFDMLTALHPTGQCDSKGSLIWNCRCDCGNEVVVPYNCLMYTNQKSCGCLKREHEQKLNTYLTHVAGTSVDILKSKKVPTDNTTGYKGVYWIRGKYVAKIVFQKKAYYLGTYDDIEEAAEARKEAEEVLFDGVAEYYAKWKTRADQDPQWAKENPVQIIVTQHDGKVAVTLLPKI